jgi:tetratricopeptide (TPR) repeat protein
MKLRTVLALGVLTLAVLPAWGQNLPATTVKQDVQKAVALYREGKLDDAIASLEKTVVEFPEDEDALGWMGFLYLRADRAASAIPLLQKALSKKPGSTDLLNNLGSSHLALKQFDQALPYFRQVAIAQPERFEAWYNIGTINLRKQDWVAAVDAFGRAARIRPEDAFVQNNLGSALEGQKNFERAASHYANASNLRKDNPAFARNAAFTFLRLQKPAAASPPTRSRRFQSCDRHRQPVHAPESAGRVPQDL